MSAKQLQARENFKKKIEEAKKIKKDNPDIIMRECISVAYGKKTIKEAKDASKKKKPRKKKSK